MRTGGVGAFAAAIDKGAGRQRLKHGRRRRHGQQRRQPGRKIAAQDVAVATIEDPARHQHGHDHFRCGLCAGQPFLKIEQAQIVFPALAHDDLLKAIGLFVEQGARIGIDLLLQGLGIGRDPHLALRLARPRMRRRQIAEGLADAGTGLGQQHVRLILHPLRREDIARPEGEFELFRPAFPKRRPRQIGTEAFRHLFVRQGHGARIAFGGLILPFFQQRPDFERRRRDVVGGHFRLI